MLGRALGGLLLCFAATAAAADVTPADPVFGVWKNPKGSVHIEIRPCGGQTCGYVVWADAEAQADARKGGTPQLVGQQLLRDFVRDDSGQWKGKVFVPDLGMTFSGRVSVADKDRLKAKGCVLGAFLCKSQVWTRVG